jgi:hypothetical protein
MSDTRIPSLYPPDFTDRGDAANSLQSGIDTAGKSSAALIELAKILGRQAAAEFLRSAASPSHEQDIAA